MKKRTSAILLLSVSLWLAGSCAQAQVTDWQDGFETYIVGQPAPDPWQGDGNGDVIIDSASFSGQKAMQLSGAGSCWEGLCDREMPVTNALLIEFAINATSSHWGGCHPYTAFAGIRNTRSWITATKGRVFVWFDRDTQTIHVGDGQISVGSWQYDQWRQAAVLYQKAATNILLTFWIDGVKSGPYSEVIDPEEDTIKYLEFGSGDGVTWVDDVRVSTYLTAPQSPVLGISLSNGVPLLSLAGEIGKSYTLEYVSMLAATNNWQSVMNYTNVLLANNPQYFLDTSVGGESQRFYRAVLLQ